jgi:HK97 family phage major capsid protein
MKTSRSFLFVALAAVAALASTAYAAVTGHTVADLMSPDMLAALGAASGVTFGTTKTIGEQITDLENTRAAKAARAAEVMSKSLAEGRSTDEAEATEFDEIQQDIKKIDADLVRLKALNDMQAAKATPVGGGSSDAAARARAPAIVRTVGNEEPGMGFARLALSMLAAKGNVVEAENFAKHAFGNDTRLQSVMKTAVAAGTTGNATWAGNLVDARNLQSEFLEFLRPRTIVGRFGTDGLPSLRRIPFNVRISGKTAAGAAQWVGEGYRKPVTKSGYAAAEHKWAKIAGISVVTEELARFSDPSIQMLVRDDLAEAVIERMDIDFINPAKAAGTGASASPASVTNGVTPIPSTATSDEEAITQEINSLWAVADETNLPATSAVYITDVRTVRGLIGLRTALGARAFPNLTITGGSIGGVPVLVSNYVPNDTSGSLFILAFASEIYLSDDGQVGIDISREATIVMDDDATATPTIGQVVSMFQTNQLAIRAERYVNWSKRRPQAVAYLSSVNWG